ncbi:hypothetical protein [Rhizobium sp. Leaf383]|uniref:DUF6197 family protein n=1 Tax=Rhizobium sp. Leaf383 TaxID=1736357 RepID=UPI00071593C1|nr:hypothetical protein [Rhizobium sp. Leaf383]KQS84282.1 hypothetical protein ASG58_21160 [Rhizobium sp. Leaf383]
MNEIYSVLERAQSLIRDPKNWAKEAYARDENGSDVTERDCNLYEATDPRATCWCSVGAVLKVADLPISTDNHPALSLLEKAAGGSGPGLIPEVNDGSTHAEIMALFDKAKELARASAA